MAIVDKIKNNNIRQGITAKHDRFHKFRLRVTADSHGFDTYNLENIGRKESLIIPRFLYDRFRAKLRVLHRDDISKQSQKEINEKVTFKTDEFYLVKSAKAGVSDIEVEYCGTDTKYKGGLTISSEALPVLLKLLYSPEVKHPNDSLDKIIAYHKLFQLSFVEGSNSINSDLQLRKDVLCQVEQYNPVLKSTDLKVKKRKQKYSTGRRPTEPKEKDGEETKEKMFKPRLGERFASEGYRVDYQSLFSRGSDQRSIKAPQGAKKSDEFGRSSASFPIPLMSSDVKSMAQVPFRCEFTLDDIKDMRKIFLEDHQSEFFIGFEVIDAIFKKNGKLKTFRFPLYYVKVELTESGRMVFLNPTDNNRVYLNHLALANLVESFSGSQASSSNIDKFFKALSNQKFEVEETFSRVYLSRHLPASESIFTRVREILLGFPGENGKGGLLSDLKLSGIEADLDSVYLYKASKSLSVVNKAIDMDLDQIQKNAYERPNKFYGSLLGKFLTPEVETHHEDKKRFCDVPWVPGALPKSTASLVGKLNDNDLVLLEGPPGTGKTFTIMNLVIHSICTGKRLLVVSDQQAAISALTEKMLEYYISDDESEASMNSKKGLWKRAVKVVSQIPEDVGSLSKWTRNLQSDLALNEDFNDYDDKIKVPYKKLMRDIDEQISFLKKAMNQLVHKKKFSDDSTVQKLSPKRKHATTVDEIAALVEFLRFMGNGIEKSDPKYREVINVRKVLKLFMDDREQMIHENYQYVYDVVDPSADTPFLCEQAMMAVQRLLKSPPKSVVALRAWKESYPENPVVEALAPMLFPRMTDEHKQSKPARWARWLRLTLRYPSKNKIKTIYKFLVNFMKLQAAKSHINEHVYRQLILIHGGIKNIHKESVPLAYEICKFTTEVSLNRNSDALLSVDYSVQALLEKIEKLMKERDQLIRKRFQHQLEKFERNAYQKSENSNTSGATKIAAALETIANKDKADFDTASIEDVRQSAGGAFPVWFCRKQVVPFLFPCAERQFDLVIVDEATQCKVDDAIPLLYRAKKLLVVGDDKQTVLSKNSVIDDYLFGEFNLEEHLRATQARGLKGGGSHIFGLVKAIKEASVMLDEHYRCPPDIIQYSNKYVYGSGLKTMKWSPKGSKSSVMVDYSEKSATSNIRVQSGKYKGLETQMLDRFLEYVAIEIKKIEKETGSKIDVEKDVALCYFLLKNQVYFEDKKGDFLMKLRRGDDVLNGAGAALQGKERDYIFYFWDISRGNMMAFTQGDDPDKRKGELNVLMSRPKKRAYHYLHKNFEKLDHRRASITDYLWKTYHAGLESGENKKFIKRTQSPSDNFVPWRRSSGELMHKVLEYMLDHQVSGSQSMDCQYSVIVGSPKFKVDLMIAPKGASSDSLALIDLSSFVSEKDPASEIVDYYFQLKRSTPGIDPMFIFLHELADERSEAFKRLKETIKLQKLKKTA